MRRIAALFVATNGVYFNLPDIIPYDINRDARLYDGPYPVIAHPPCARWGRYWSGGPSLANTTKRKKMGDDGGCFTSALVSVRKYGGVLEHPEASHAYLWHELKKPPKKGGWIPADNFGGWTCCVGQGHYGHLARKAIWLYVNGVTLQELIWGPRTEKKIRLESGFILTRREKEPGQKVLTTLKTGSIKYNE